MVRCQEVGGNALTVCMLSGPRASSILVKGSANPLSFYTTLDTGLISGSGRFPGVGNGNSLQYSCLGSPMDRGAWWATVCGVAKSWIWLNARAGTHTHTPYSIPQVPCGWPFTLFPVIHYYKNNTEVDILASKSLGTHALVYKGDSPQMELVV